MSSGDYESDRESDDNKEVKKDDNKEDEKDDNKEDEKDDEKDMYDLLGIIPQNRENSKMCRCV